MWGQTTVRDRSVGDLRASRIPSWRPNICDQAYYQWFAPDTRFFGVCRLPDTFPTPAPPLPDKYFPIPTSDIFDNVEGSAVPNPSLSKPVPAIRTDSVPLRDSQEPDSNSIVAVIMPGEDGSHTTTPIAKGFKEITPSSKRDKRWSVSVSDIDVKRALQQNGSMPPRLKGLKRTSNGWGSSLGDTFSEELSGLVPPLSLQLQDPVTPVKRLPNLKGKGPALPSNSQDFENPFSLLSSPTMPANTPIVNIGPASIIYNPPLSFPEPAISPPRSPSLHTPIKKNPTSYSSCT